MSILETPPSAAGKISSPVAEAAHKGLLATPKWLPAWLFYDARGSELFEQITRLPEYYPTRTERAIFTTHAENIIRAALELSPARTGKSLRLVELGAGSASKTGILLSAAVRQQGATEYLPIDVSVSALDEAQRCLSGVLHNVTVRPQVANYVTEPFRIPRHDGPTLALYIGSSIGNFHPDEAVEILRNLRTRLRPGDSLLLGTDLVKDSKTMLAAYDDASGVTAAFNLNLLRHLNRELNADFDLSAFQHRAIWNQQASRIEMHLCSTRAQTVKFPNAGLHVSLAAGETIHTENSYKFTSAAIQSLLQQAGFSAVQTWHDANAWFAVTLAAAI